MKILFITPYFSGSGVDYPSTIATELLEKGHNVIGLCFAEYPQIDTIDTKTKWTLRSIDRYIWKNVSKRYPWITSTGRWAFNWFFYYRWKRAVVNELRDEGYDAIVTIQICIAPPVTAANEEDIPSVIITTGPATVKYDPTDKGTDKTPRFTDFPISKKILYPFIWAVHLWNTTAFTTASEVVAMSEFDATVTRETFGRESTLSYIPVPLERFKTDEGKGSKITLVNPRDPNKGLDTFLQIAAALPEESFLIAGSLYDDSYKSTIDEMDNVMYLGWCEDMSEVYASTKLLLMPSTYQEGGGRVIIGGFASGIPAIGSDIGGIPNYIGDGGDVIEDYTDPAAWVTAIKQYLSDDAYYERMSDNAQRRSELFDQDHIVSKFEEILMEVTADECSES